MAIPFFHAALVGIIAHLGVFIHGEWHLQSLPLVFGHLGGLAALIVFRTYLLGSAALSETASCLALFSVYLITLFASIVTYRIFFHRLRFFPGPRMAAISKLWHAWECRDSANHLYMDKVFEKYGPVVRTGPEEIAIFTPGAIEALDGHGNHNTRTDWYDIVFPRTSPIFSRRPEDHKMRRLVWSRALSSRSVLEYLPRILRQISALEELILAQSGKPLLLNDVMSWFAFDSMGEFAFNEDFGMMKTAHWHEAISQQRSALTLLGPFSVAIWAVRFAFSFAPFLSKVKDWSGMVAFCDSRIARRLQLGADEPDIAAWFIEEYERSKSTSSQRDRDLLLSGNTISVIVGGSDTTAPSLILLWYALAKYPAYAEAIYAEVREVKEGDPSVLAALPVLNGFLNETMRLLPAALTGGNRVTPPEGMMLGETFIPGGVKICAPKYTIFRLDSAFEDAKSFVPERWYSKPEMVKDRKAFAPFGTGRRQCVGKNLALTQIRLVAWKLLRRFKVRFAPSQDVQAVERDMKDQLTAQPGLCRVIFEPREGCIT